MISLRCYSFYTSNLLKRVEISEYTSGAAHTIHRSSSHEVGGRLGHRDLNISRARGLTGGGGWIILAIQSKLAGKKKKKRYNAPTHLHTHGVPLDSGLFELAQVPETRPIQSTHDRIACRSNTCPCLCLCLQDTCPFRAWLIIIFFLTRRVPKEPWNELGPHWSKQ